MSKDDQLLFRIFAPGTREVSLHCSPLGRTGIQSSAKKPVCSAFYPHWTCVLQEAKLSGVWGLPSKQGREILPLLEISHKQ